jgi:hypothetical protein
VSYWEPRWVRKEFKSHGITVVTCLDLSTSLILCPLCSSISIDDLCPEGREGNMPVTDTALFMSVEDLINHMRTHWHTKKYKKIKMPTVREVGEESEEGSLRQFTDSELTRRKR